MSNCNPTLRLLQMPKNYVRHDDQPFWWQLDHPEQSWSKPRPTRGTSSSLDSFISLFTAPSSNPISRYLTMFARRCLVPQGWVSFGDLSGHLLSRHGVLATCSPCKYAKLVTEVDLPRRRRKPATLRRRKPPTRRRPERASLKTSGRQLLLSVHLGRRTWGRLLRRFGPPATLGGGPTPLDILFLFRGSRRNGSETKHLVRFSGLWDL